MTIQYNVPGKKRKELATEIGRWLEVDVEYLGAPTFAYRIDYFTLDKDGNLSFDDRADSEVIEQLIEHLLDESFECDMSEPEETSICISMPDSLFTETALANLDSLIAAKGELIKKALGVNELPILKEDGKVSFPWFKGEHTPEEIKAYDHFICAICEMVRNQKRVNAKEKSTDNDKYAFRCFLLRLGFIGSDYKAERKILLSKLSGSAAFKEVKMMRFPSKEIVESIRKRYPVGCRVELLRMDDVQAPPVGTKGTVRGVDDIGSIMVAWDNGCGLSVAYGEDSCRRIDHD